MNDNNNNTDNIDDSNNSDNMVRDILTNTEQISVSYK